MKPTYKGYEGKKNGSNFITLPPVGAYVAEIQEVRFVKAEDENHRDRIECFMEITEGEYKNRFHEVYKDQDEKWGKATYRGIFRLVPPVEGEEDDWRKRTFEGNLWCVEQSNAGYTWDWDEKKLKGKKVGISLRKRLYTGHDRDGNPVDRETVEIGRFETVDDVKNSKCKPMRERDQREKRGDDSAEASTDGTEFTNVSDSISVPW